MKIGGRTDSQMMWDCFIYLWRTPAKIAGEPIHRCCTFVSMMKIGTWRTNSFTKWKLVVVEAIPGNEQITLSIGGELPLSQRFFLKFFFGKEKASRQGATTSPEEARRERKTTLSPRRFATRCQRAMSARSLFREENFQEKPVGPE